MKNAVKFLCCAIALLTLLSCFAACGGDADDTTLPSGVGTEEPESGRNAVKDTVPEGLDFGGDTVTFFVRDNLEMWKKEMDVNETTNDTLYDAIFYRNSTVEDRLGVEITQIEQPGHHYERNSWNQSLRNAVLTKSGDYDAAAIYQAFATELAFEGCYYNVLDIPHINLDKPWWNQMIRKELTLFDSLYFLAGDLTVTQAASANGIFFNKRLLGEFYGTQNLNLYDVVDKGEWTIDYLHELVSGVWTDTNSDGTIDSHDVVGFSAYEENGGAMLDVWIPALGIKVTQIEDDYPVLTIYDEHTVAAWEKVQKLYNENPGTIVKGLRGNTPFMEGIQLFALANLDSGSTFRDMTDSYGVLPMPKFDTAQKDYRTKFSTNASLVTILSTCLETEKVGATIELMAAESYKQVTPAYYEVCLKGKYSDAPDDARMYDKILEGAYFDFGFCYAYSIGDIGTFFRKLDRDIAQHWEQNKIMFDTKFNEVIDKLDEVSFNIG